MTHKHETLDGYDAVPSRSACTGCAFDDYTDEALDGCLAVSCTPEDRADGQIVIFIKKVGA